MWRWDFLYVDDIGIEGDSRLAVSAQSRQKGARIGHPLESIPNATRVKFLALKRPYKKPYP